MIQVSHALGINPEFINFDALEVPVHCDLVPLVLKLKREAQEAGFQLGLCSAYRSFEQQLKIWNEKVSGKRPLFDANGEKLDVNSLEPEQIVDHILLWSALPGTSRHHWGSDFDVVDADVVKGGYRPQLTLAECSIGGEFHDFQLWLDAYLKENKSEFYRPYTQRKEFGVSPEPWHLSYRPLAQSFSRVMTLEALQDLLKKSDLALLDQVLARLDHIYIHYVQRYF